LLAMIEISPVGPAAIVSLSSGKTGIVTRVPVFSVSIVMTPLRICCLPSLAASPRRRPVYRYPARHRRCRGWADR
jgi:hypothetical protein